MSRYDGHSRLCTLLICLCLTGITQSAVAAGKRFSWPHGTRAAVSLSYDDALDSQLDNAIPALDKFGLKGSFYPTLSSSTLVKRLPEWRAAAAEGHELGNHTLFHQCSAKLSGRGWVTPENDLDHTPATQMVAQIKIGNAMLHAIDGRIERTFTVPCGDAMAAGVDYLPLIRSEFVAIKFGPGLVIPDMADLDPYAVAVDAPSDVTGQQLIDLVKAAVAKGTMINFTFHGIGGDYLTTSTQAHEELLAYLAAHRDLVWTDTFINIMTYVKKQQRASATNTAH
jgi:peptidoglycan/xylan/chitin deacetylase (PgdA/CDA1 family)